jgi:preprotein translocase SecE subunit
MAKTRAQRKAERRAREAEERKRSDGGRAESRAQHDTQVPISGDVAEVEAFEEGLAAGASEQDLETPTRRSRARPSAPRQRPEGSREAQARRAEASRARAARQETETGERRTGRGGVIGFLISCWQELKKVQWPDRETLIQATAVTILFVAVAAAYLGALDALFDFLIKRIL